jgi:hypothetical protein
MGGALQSKYADAVNSLVSNATAYRNNVQQRYDYKKARTDANKKQFLEEEQQGWSNFGANVAGASAGLLNAYGNGAFDSTAKKGAKTGATPNQGTQTQTSNADMTPLQKLWRQDYQKTSFGGKGGGQNDSPLGADTMLPEYVNSPDMFQPAPEAPLTVPKYKGGFSPDLTPDYLND